MNAQKHINELNAATDALKDALKEADKAIAAIDHPSKARLLQLSAQLKDRSSGKEISEIIKELSNFVANVNPQKH